MFGSSINEIYIPLILDKTFLAKKHYAIMSSIRFFIYKFILFYNLEKEPNRIVFRRDTGNTVTFIGLISHAGSLHQDYKRNEFVVSWWYYLKKTRIWYVNSQR